MKEFVWNREGKWGHNCWHSSLRNTHEVVVCYSVNKAHFHDRCLIHWIQLQNTQLVMWEALMAFVKKAPWTSTNYSCGELFWLRKLILGLMFNGTDINWIKKKKLPSLRMPIHRTVHHWGWMFLFPYAVRKRCLLLPCNYEFQAS